MTEADFNAAMYDIYRRANREVSYNPSAFLLMLEEHGGLETAKRLLAQPGVTDGFTTLWQADRLDLTVEAHVLQPAFSDLFSRRDLKVAERRLRDHGWAGARDD
ncbi:MAG: hypothetical protein GY798_00760 [Hyphomicrobiales bacterium]|nr:hypothetical protein [Hyphomicrobiales bacterium]